MIKIPRWGPPKLREILGQIEAAINQTQPLAGIGIDVDVTKGGTQISVQEAKQNQKPPGQQQAGGSSSGTPTDVYGAYNGARATFHFLQSAPPTETP